MAKKKDKRAELLKAEKEVEQLKGEIAEKLRLAGKAGTCANCGKTFEITRPWHKFCSLKCRMEYWGILRSDNIIRELTCPVCSSNFSTNDNRKVYCSRDCYLKASNERAKLRGRIDD